MGRRIRILIMNYLDSSAPGGISKVVSELGKGFNELGHLVRIIQPYNPQYDTNEDYNGFRGSEGIWKLQLHHLRLGDIKQIKKEITDFRPDIINIHGSRTFLSPWAVIKIKRIFPNIGLVFSPHHDSRSGETFSGKYLFWLHKATLLRMAYNAADAITVCSEFERVEVSKCFSENKNKIFVVPNGIEEIAASRVPIIDRKKRIVSAGYLFELKGIQHTISALKILHDMGENEWKFIICGEGPYRKNLERLARKLNVSQHIEWRGFVTREELISTINEAKVATLVSRSENFGIFAAECLSLGVPTIVTDVTALAELDWIEWCYKIPYPVDSYVLANAISNASRKNTGSIMNEGNIQSWRMVTKNMESVFIGIKNKARV